MPNPKIQQEINKYFDGKYSPHDFWFLFKKTFVSAYYLLEHGAPGNLAKMLQYSHEMTSHYTGNKINGLVINSADNSIDILKEDPDFKEKTYLEFKEAKKTSEKYIAGLDKTGKKFEPYLNLGIKMMECEKGNYSEAILDNYILQNFHSQIACGPKFIKKKVNGKETNEVDYEQMEKNLGELFTPLMKFYSNFSDLLDLEFEKQKNEKLGWTPLTYGAYVNKLKKTYNAVIKNYEEIAKINKKYPHKFDDALENKLDQFIELGEGSRDIVSSVYNMKIQLKALENGWDINELGAVGSIGIWRAEIEKDKKVLENKYREAQKDIPELQKKLTDNENKIKELEEKSAEYRKKPAYKTVKEELDQYEAKYEAIFKSKQSFSAGQQEANHLILTMYTGAQKRMAEIDPNYPEIDRLRKENKQIREEGLPNANEVMNAFDAKKKVLDDFENDLNLLEQECGKKVSGDAAKLEIIGKIKNVGAKLGTLDGHPEKNIMLPTINHVENIIQFRVKKANKEKSYDCDSSLELMEKWVGHKHADQEYKSIYNDLVLLNNDMKKADNDYMTTGTYPAVSLAKREQSLLDRITAYKNGQGKGKVHENALGLAFGQLYLRHEEDRKLPNIGNSVNMNLPVAEKKAEIADNKSDNGFEENDDFINLVDENDGFIDLSDNGKEENKKENNKAGSNIKAEEIPAQNPAEKGKEYDELIAGIKKKLYDEALQRKNYALSLKGNLDVLKTEKNNRNMAAQAVERRKKITDSAMRSLYYRVLLNKYDDGSRDNDQKERDTEKLREAVNKGLERNSGIFTNIEGTKFYTAFSSRLYKESAKDVPEVDQEGIVKICEETIAYVRKNGKENDKKIAEKLAFSYGLDVYDKNGEKTVPEDNAAFEFKTGLETKRYRNEAYDEKSAPDHVQTSVRFKPGISEGDIKKELGGIYFPLTEYYVATDELSELNRIRANKVEQGTAVLETKAHKARYVQALNKFAEAYEKLVSAHQEQYEVDKELSEHSKILTGNLSAITGVNTEKAGNSRGKYDIANLQARSAALSNGWDIEDAGIIGFLGETKKRLEELEEAEKNNPHFIEFREKFNRLYENNINKKVTNRYEKAAIASEIDNFVNDNTKEFYLKKEGTEELGYEDAALSARDPYMMEGRTAAQNTDKLLKELIAVDPALMRSSPEFRSLREGLEKLSRMAKNLPENPTVEQFDEFCLMAEKVYTRAGKYIKAKEKEESDYLAKNGKEKTRKASTDKRMNFAAGLKDKLEALMIANSGNRGLEFKGSDTERALAKYSRLQRKEENYRQNKINTSDDKEKHDIYNSFFKSVYLETVLEKFKHDEKFGLDEFKKAITVDEIKNGAKKLKDAFKKLGLKNHIEQVIEAKTDFAGDKEFGDPDFYPKMIADEQKAGYLSDDKDSVDFYVKQSEGVGLSWVRFELKNAAYAMQRNQMKKTGRLELDYDLADFGYKKGEKGALDKISTYKDAPADDYLLDQVYNNQQKLVIDEVDLDAMDEKALLGRKDFLGRVAKMPFESDGTLSLEKLSESDKLIGADLATAAGRVNRKISLMGEIEKAEIKAGLKTFDYDEEVAEEIERSNKDYLDNIEKAKKEIGKINKKLEEIEQSRKFENRFRNLKPGSVLIVKNNFVEVLGYDKDMMYIQFHGTNESMNGNDKNYVPEEFRNGFISVHDMASLKPAFKTREVTVERQAGNKSIKEKVPVIENASDIRKEVVKENKNRLIDYAEHYKEERININKNIYEDDHEKLSLSIIKEIKNDHPEIKNPEKKYLTTKSMSSLINGTVFKMKVLNEKELKKDLPEYSKKYDEKNQLLIKKKEMLDRIVNDNYHRQISKKQIDKEFDQILEDFDFAKRIDQIKNGRHLKLRSLDSGKYYNFTGNNPEIIKKYGNVEKAVENIVRIENDLGNGYKPKTVKEDKEYLKAAAEIEKEYKTNADVSKKMFGMIDPKALNDSDFMDSIPEKYRDPEGYRKKKLDELDRRMRMKNDGIYKDKDELTEEIKKDKLLMGIEPDPVNKKEKEKPVKNGKPDNIIIEEKAEEKHIKDNINVINDPTGEYVEKMKLAHIKVMTFEHDEINGVKLTKEKAQEKAAAEKEREDYRKELKSIGYNNKDICELVVGDGSRAEKYSLMLDDPEFGNGKVLVDGKTRKALKETAVRNRFAGKDDLPELPKNELSLICTQVDKVASAKSPKTPEKAAAKMLLSLYNDVTGNKVKLNDVLNGSLVAINVRYQDEKERKAIASNPKPDQNTDKLMIDLAYKALYNKVISDECTVKKTSKLIYGDRLLKYEYSDAKDKFIDKLSKCREYKEAFEKEILKSKPVKEEDIIKISDKAMNHALEATKDGPEAVELMKQLGFKKAEPEKIIENKEPKPVKTKVNMGI